MSTYAGFLQSKRIVSEASGFDLPASSIHPALYDFQRDIVRWALKRGRAAVFADCGLGKSFIQLEWARHIPGPVLIVAPLSVAEQTIREGAKLDIPVRMVRGQDEIRQDIAITNYEILDHFIGAPLTGIVLDESSILKSIDGATRKLLLDQFTHIPYRLCCTATPCPNDIAELANHAQFLGVMSRQEMLASFFVHDQDGWRLRGHARQPFYRWLASWSLAMKSPEDLGYDGTRFVLPLLVINDAVVETEWRRPGGLFPGDLKGITDRVLVRKASVTDRVARAVEIVRQSDGQVIVWCGLNAESEAIAALLTEAVEVSGDQSPSVKNANILDFLEGRKRVLVSKIRIAGFGLNFQCASTQVFVGLSDSYESYYQGIRRSWRYGQTQPVRVYIVVTDHETEIVENVRRKEIEAETLSREIILAAKEYEMEELGKLKTHGEVIENADYAGDHWRFLQGDAIERMAEIPDASVDLSIFSPPFIALYTYSATERDLGNSKSPEQFFSHFRFVIDGLMRVTKPGRLCCVHVGPGNRPAFVV